MTLRTLPICALLCACTASEGDTGTTGDDACAAGDAPTLTLGKGELEYTSLDDSAAELIHGPQGGYHINIALQATDLAAVSVSSVSSLSPTQSQSQSEAEAEGARGGVEAAVESKEAPSSKASREAPAQLVLDVVQKSLAEYFLRERADVCKVQTALLEVNRALALKREAPVSAQTLQQFLALLQKRNHVMCSNEDIYLI